MLANGHTLIHQIARTVLFISSGKFSKYSGYHYNRMHYKSITLQPISQPVSQAVTRR